MSAASTLETSQAGRNFSPQSWKLGSSSFGQAKRLLGPSETFIACLHLWEPEPTLGHLMAKNRCESFLYGFDIETLKCAPRSVRFTQDIEEALFVQLLTNRSKTALAE